MQRQSDIIKTRTTETDKYSRISANNDNDNSTKYLSQATNRDYEKFTTRRKADTYSPYSSRTFPSLRQDSLVTNGVPSASSKRIKQSYKSMLEKASPTLSMSSDWQEDLRDNSNKMIYFEKYKPMTLSPAIKSTRDSTPRISGHYHPHFHGSTVIRLS